MAETSIPELPPKYYLHNFLFTLSFVETYYGFLLSKTEKQFIAGFRRLPENSQCTYVRMHNRKGVFFRINKLQYAEIEALPSQIALLKKGKWVTPLEMSSMDEARTVLSIFTKPELAEMGRLLEIGSLNPLKKEEAILTLLELAGLAELTAVIEELDPVIQVQRTETAAFIMFLFFGGTEANMTEFVVRDIGHVRFEDYRSDQFVPRFKSRKEATDAFWAAQAYRDYKELASVFPSEDVYEWLMEHQKRFLELEPIARPRADRLLNRFARQLERERLNRQARKVYELATSPPSRERRVRLLQKEGFTDEALLLCNQIEEQPFNAEELFFAMDFKAKLEKKTFRKSVTQHLKEARTLEVPEEFIHRVETGVLAYYQHQGYEGCFAENYLWRNFFGLLFWEIIYDPQYAAIHHPFQRVPSDLFAPEFMEIRRPALEKQTSLLTDPEKTLAFFRATWQAKAGISNPFTGWFPDELHYLEQLLRHLSAEQLKKVMLEMARDLKNNLTGFPDLFIWKEDDYAFLEVKSPNDQLSAQQLYWIRFMQKAGIATEAIRVSWV